MTTPAIISDINDIVTRLQTHADRFGDTAATRRIYKAASVKQALDHTAAIKPCAHVIFDGIHPITADILAPAEGDFQQWIYEAFEIVIQTSEQLSGSRGAAAMEQGMALLENAMRALINWAPGDDDPATQRRQSCQLDTAFVSTENGERLALILAIKLPNCLQATDGFAGATSDLHAVRVTQQGGASVEKEADTTGE